MKGVKTWGKSAGNRKNNRGGEVDGKHYNLGGLKYYKYSYILNGKGIYTLREIHEAIAERKDIFCYDKFIFEWSKFNYNTAKFEKI